MIRKIISKWLFLSLLVLPFAGKAATDETPTEGQEEDTRA